MDITVISMYTVVAISSALICAFLRARFELDVFISNLMIGSVCAWLGVTLFGAVGPLIWGLPILAAFGLALPSIFAFNFVLARDEKQGFSADVIELRPMDERPAAKAV